MLHDVNGFRCGSMSESSVLDAIELLRQEGADVRYHDPYVPSIRIQPVDRTCETHPESDPLRIRRN
jgi:UDP-N-acetyl-D-mannosaminuronate dehydrogenase